MSASVRHPLPGRRLGVLLVLIAAVATGCTALPVGQGGDKAAADRAYDAGRYRDAASRYQHYLESAPRDPHAWYRLGNARVELGRLRPAETAFYRALDADPAMARARHNLGLVQLRLAWRSLVEAHSRLPADAARDKRTAALAACLLQGLGTWQGPGQCPQRTDNEDEP
ncbi:tetratricopeptide repeat protein [Arhodomonas sp. KWT2]|nr:tetratricopeptide repeat protein [Arhodomonas sp. KWT]